MTSVRSFKGSLIGPPIKVAIKLKSSKVRGSLGKRELRIFVKCVLIPKRRTRCYRLEMVLLNDPLNVRNLVLKVEPFDLVVSGVLVQPVLVGFNFLRINFRIIANHDWYNVHQFS